MSDPREQETDARLREALDPDAGQAAQVARRALEPCPGALDRLLRRIFEWQPPFTRGHRRGALAGLSLLIVLGGWLAVWVVWLVLTRGPASPVPIEPAAARYSLTNRDGIVVVGRPDGGAVILHSGAGAGDPARGMILIVQGDNRP